MSAVRTLETRPLAYGWWLCLAALAGAACERDPALLAAMERPLLGDKVVPLHGTASGVIRIDGSSTVYPVAEAVAEEFRIRHGGRVTIGVSGTRAGLEKLCNAEVAISGASRLMRASEGAVCRARGVSYVELPVAYDGITVVVHPDNHWAAQLTVAELAALWRPEAQRQVLRWNQIRADWPDSEIHLLGPGVGSGTYDYFTRAIVGREHASRGDYSSSEDDHLIARGVSQDPLSLGFFGYAYYALNRERLRLVGVDDEQDDNGAGAVLPSAETVRNGSYAPLSRPIFLYVNLAAAAQPEVTAFVRFFLAEAGRLAEEVGYIALSDAGYRLARERFESRAARSPFGGVDARVGVSVESLLAVE